MLIVFKALVDCHKMNLLGMAAGNIVGPKWRAIKLFNVDFEPAWLADNRFIDWFKIQIHGPFTNREVNKLSITWATVIKFAI
jgi:hypothetical protein